jgi:hypothetical protein
MQRLMYQLTEDFEGMELIEVASLGLQQLQDFDVRVLIVDGESFIDIWRLSTRHSPAVMFYDACRNEW